MSSKNGLPKQPDALQQLSLIKQKISINWKAAFIFLIIVDAVSIYLLGSSGYGAEFINFMFVLLPIANLLFVFSDISLTAKSDGFQLKDIGSLFLIIVNLIFIAGILLGIGFGQYRGLGSLAFLPYLYVLAINDFVVALFYIKTQNPRGIVVFICYAVVFLVSYLLLQFVLSFIFLPFFRF